MAALSGRTRLALGDLGPRPPRSDFATGRTTRGPGARTYRGLTPPSNLLLRRVLAFYAIAFGIAWGVEGLVFLFGGFTSATLILLYGLGWLAPSFAAGVMVRREGGSVRAHFAQLLRWRPSPLYLTALLLPTLALFIAGPAFQVRTSIFLVGPPLAEEPGWRGYAYDRLRRTWAPLPAALLTGILWAVWHLPTWFLPGVNADLALLPAYLLWIVAAGLLAAWFYDRLGLTGGLTLHAGLNLGLVPVRGASFGLAAGLLAAFAVAVYLVKGWGPRAGAAAR